MAGDGDEDAPAIMVVGAWDNTKFLFLEIGVTGVVMYVRRVTRREEHACFLIKGLFSPWFHLSFFVV
jgi:hypothetical protein